MAEKKYKETKKLYSRKYRKENKDKVNTYLKKTSKKRSSRAKARKVISAPKGKEVHHKDGNPLNNSKSNLKIAKKHHGGGAGKGNQNAKKKKK